MRELPQQKKPKSDADLSTPVAYHIHHTIFHRHRIEAAMNDTGHDLIQEEGDQVLVRNEPPEVKIEIVAVDLNLLEAVATERPQSDALKQGLQSNLDHSREDGNLGELDR